MENEEKKIKRREIISILFVATAIGSMLAMIPSVYNYTEFYQAIESFEVRLTKITMNETAIESGRIYVMAELAASNPTRFSGIQIIGGTLSLTYSEDRPTLSITLPQAPVGPNQEIVWKAETTFDYSKNPPVVGPFVAYLQLKPQRIEWAVSALYALKAYDYGFSVQTPLFYYITDLQG